MAEEKLLGTAETNGSTEIRVRLSEYKGKKFLDIRKFYKDGHDEMQPTSKGITISTSEAVDAVVSIIHQYIDEIREVL